MHDTPPPEADVTIVVATYNRARYLSETLRSLLGQTVSARRVIVVDDGSTDATPAVLAAHAPRVEAMRRPNGGKAAALNQALSSIDSEWVWFFDDDDLAAPDALERLYRCAGRAAEADFVFGGWQRFVEDGAGARRILDTAEVVDARGQALFLLMLDGNRLMMQGTLVRTAAVRRLGGFDERLIRSQDYAFLLALTRDFPGVPVPGSVFLWRQHDGARGSAAQQVRAQDVRRAWARYDRLVFATLHATTPLDRYLDPSRCVVGQAAREVEARLRRMRVMARAGLWREVAADLRAMPTESIACDRVALRTLAREMSSPPYDTVLEDFAADASDAQRLWRAGRGPLARRLLWLVARAFVTAAWRERRANEPARCALNLRAGRRLAFARATAWLLPGDAATDAATPTP